VRVHAQYGVGNLAAQDRDRTVLSRAAFRLFAMHRLTSSIQASGTKGCRSAAHVSENPYCRRVRHGVEQGTPFEVLIRYDGVVKGWARGYTSAV
jgi:hypothetical protein